MVQIRFKASGANSLLGGFSSGDIARVGEALAHHLVEEARVAVYVTAPVAVDAKKPAKTIIRRRQPAATESPT